MTDKHDKLVEAAQAAGFCYVGGTLFAHDIDLTPKLAAFASAHVASLCAGVGPVAFMFQHSETGRIAFVDAWQKENGWALANPRYSEVGTMHGASTVASLTAQRDQALARVAELEKDAARYRWLRSVPNAFKAQRIVNDTPHGMDATIDAAMNGGNQ